MEPGDQCFLRLTLHSRGRPTIPRGARGTLVRQNGTEATVEFSHEIGRVIIPNIAWLEPYPGTFSKGFAALTPYGIYKTGMICSDIKFPTPDQLQYRRFERNMQMLLNSGTGASFYDGVSALNILGTFHARYPGYMSDLRKVGLIICEHIWPWEAGNRSQFLLKMVRSLVGQFSCIPKIVLLRSTDVAKIRRELREISRVVLLDGADVQLHYQPLRMDWDSPDLNPINSDETAIYIKPIMQPSEHIVIQPLHIPREVLLQIFKGRQTLFLASGTCDSQVACLKYLLAQLRRHNIAPPNRA